MNGTKLFDKDWIFPMALGNRFACVIPDRIKLIPQITFMFPIEKAK